jgi:hypothetical protein
MQAPEKQVDQFSARPGEGDPSARHDGPSFSGFT